MRKETFDYLAAWLVEAITPVFEKNARTRDCARAEGKMSKGVLPYLWQMFNDNICTPKDNRIRFADGVMYVYNGKWFERVVEKSFLKELVRRVLKELGVGVAYQMYGAKDIASECHDRIVNSAECAYAPDRRYICFKNGIFDVKDGVLHPHHMRFCTDLIMDYDYDENASFILWDTKLKEIIPGTGFRDVFQQFCGSLLAKRSELKIEYLAYLYGSGSNGKSVLASAIANTLGESYYSTFTPQQLFKDSSAMFNMKELDGKILNVCDDLTAKDFSGGEFKRFISGEKFKARGAYSKDFVMIQPPLMLCCTNDFPDCGDDSWGHHRRQLVIQTTKRQWNLNERDPQLTAKLSVPRAKARIFTWMYEGYCKLMRNKGNIEMAEEVQEANARRMADSSPARRWAKDRGYCKTVSAGNADPRWRPLSELYADCQRYCERNGYTKPKDARHVSAMLQSMEVETRRRADGIWVCAGISGIDTDNNGCLKPYAGTEKEH